MVVTVLTPDVPVLHVYVGDPEKTDGERIPGYRPQHRSCGWVLSRRVGHRAAGYE